MGLSIKQRLRRGLCIFCPRRLSGSPSINTWRSCPCCHHRYRIEYGWNARLVMWEQRPLINAVICEHRKGKPDGEHHEEVMIVDAS